MKTPCEGCAEREIGCHGKCDKYKEYKAWRAKVLAAKDDTVRKEAIAVEGPRKRKEARKKREARK